MNISPLHSNYIFSVWDKLADIGTTNLEQGRKLLLESVCHLVRAQNATWIGVVRVGPASEVDPMKGWRPHTSYFLYPTARIERKANSLQRELERGDVDEVCQFNAKHMGEYRINLLSEMVSPQWF